MNTSFFAIHTPIKFRLPQLDPSIHRFLFKRFGHLQPLHHIQDLPYDLLLPHLPTPLQLNRPLLDAFYRSIYQVLLYLCRIILLYAFLTGKWLSQLTFSHYLVDLFFGDIQVLAHHFSDFSHILEQVLFDDFQNSVFLY